MGKINLSVLLLMLLYNFAIAQKAVVTGTVTEKENGKPIVGATVHVVGNTRLGTLTDVEGKYKLEIEGLPVKLQINFVGFQTERVVVTESGNYDIALDIDEHNLEEIIVVGYTTRKRQDITGSIETIDSKNIEQIPNASFTQTLQGQATGLLSATSSGRPGAEALVLIRGLNSINASNTPLYVLDGIPMSGGNFSSINPNDIESITVLKDASAAAIYGSRATSGVIVVTTKRGLALENAEITYRGQYGSIQLSRNPYDMMNTEEKLAYEEFVLLDAGQTYQDRYGSVYMDSLRRIDENWFDALFRNANMQSHELSFRGGSQRAKYYFSGSYLSQEGILPRSDFERYNLRMNLDSKLNGITTFGSSFTVGYEKTNYSSAEDGGSNVYNPAFAAYLINPYIKIQDDYGRYNEQGFLVGGNPLKEMELNYLFSNSLEMSGSTFIELEPIKKLKIKSALGVNYSNDDSKNYLNPFSKWGMESDGEISKSWNKYIKLVTTNTLQYSHVFADDHNFSGIVGHEAIGGYLSTLDATVRVLPNDKVDVISEGADPQKPGETISEYKVISYFSAFYYDYNNKYYIDFSYRRDGSSRFGANNRWANFASVGLQWDIKNEIFMENISLFSKLKLYGGYGTTGNYAIGNYASMALYGYTSYGNQAAGALLSSGNADLTWEKAIKANVGIDIGFLNRYSLKIELYNNKTTDMLFSVPYSYTTGFTSGLDNVGTLRNRGIELDAKLQLIRKRNFTWQLNGNISYNQNEIIELYNGETEIDNGGTILRVGEPIGSIQMVRYAGVNPATGQAMWYDKDGKLTDTYSDNDKVVLNKSFVPPMQASITSIFTYHDLTLSIFFTGMFKKYLYNNNRFFIESDGEFAAYGQSKKMLDHWTTIGEINDIPDPRYRSKFSDDRLIEDASFIRLKNVTLSYTLPQNIITKTKIIHNCRIYAQGQNLLTFTEYTGFDPEYMSSLYEVASYPQPKTITIGLDLTF